MRYLRIFRKAVAFSIAETTIFRSSFLIFFAWLFIDTLIKIIFFKAIFSQVGSIGGWSYYDCFMLVVLQGMMYDFAWTFYISGLERFVESFSEGRFDFILTKPMHPVTYLTLTGFSARSFSGGRIPLFIYAIVVFPFIWQLPNVLAAILFFFAGLVAMHALFYIMATVCFYLVEGSYAFEIIYNVVEGNRLPSTVYPLALRFIFTFIVPIFFVTNFPVMALKGVVNLNFSFAAVAIAIALEIIAYKVWDIAIRRYSSASS